MGFYIQVSNPTFINKVDEEDENLWDVIESIFPFYNEKAFFVWNNIYIPICYKYDIGIMMNDILEMLDNLLNKEEGELSISWPSDSFSSTWELVWNTDLLIIDSKWTSVNGCISEKLNEENIIKMNKKSFINEWKKLLQIIKCSILDAGYRDFLIVGLDKLIYIESEICGFGELYSTR